MCWLLNYIITNRDLFNDIHYDWIFQKSRIQSTIFMAYLYSCKIQNKVGKTKSKFKEVLQMSYLKPSCNCKFCQLWEKVFLFIIASTNPTVNLNDALFTVPSRDVPRQHFTKTKISSRKKKNFSKNIFNSRPEEYIIYLNINSLQNDKLIFVFRTITVTPHKITIYFLNADTYLR